MASGECAHTEKGVSDFEEGLTVTSASSHYADKIREWEPTRHPTSNTSKREKERGERGRNCKHACNSARANQNVMSLRSVDDDGGEGGGRLGPSAAGGGDLRAGKKRCHKSCYSTPSLGRRARDGHRAKPDKKPRSTTMLERPRVGWQRAIMSSRGMRTSG